jgi:hypothetical protein
MKTKTIVKIIIVVILAVWIILTRKPSYNNGEFTREKIKELREWSYSQPKYYYYDYNTGTDSCATQFIIFQNFDKKLIFLQRNPLPVNSDKRFEAQKHYDKVDFGFPTVCYPNTPYYIYSTTEDSLWVKVVTFGFRLKPSSKGLFRWGYAYKPYLKNKPPDKDKECTSKYYHPTDGNWDN